METILRYVYEGNKTCLSLPLEVHGDEVLWPWLTHEDRSRPCICPIVDRIQECVCFNDTGYDLKVEKTSDINNHTLRSLCWINLNRRMNNTRILLREVRCENCDTHNRVEVEIYKELLWIIIEGMD